MESGRPIAAIIPSMRILLAIALLLIAAFCLFGFMASFEPGPNHVYFRVGYAVVGVLCGGLAVAVLARRRP